MPLTEEQQSRVRFLKDMALEVQTCLRHKNSVDGGVVDEIVLDDDKVVHIVVDYWALLKKYREIHDFGSHDKRVARDKMAAFTACVIMRHLPFCSATGAQTTEFAGLANEFLAYRFASVVLNIDLKKVLPAVAEMMVYNLYGLSNFGENLSSAEEYCLFTWVVSTMKLFGVAYGHHYDVRSDPLKRPLVDDHIV